MTEVESEFFRIVDAFARTQLKCFLAEFFPDRDGNKYILCIRPRGTRTGTERDYVCCYLHVDGGAVSAVADAHDADAQERLLNDIQQKVKASPIFKR